MFAIIEKSSGTICGYAGYADYKPNKGYAVAALPEGFTEELTDVVVYKDGKLVFDEAKRLAREKDIVRAKIKEEAQQRIEAISWRLERAREREFLGVAGLTDIDTALAEREMIRQTSNVIEAQLDSLETVEAVRAFTWAYGEIVFSVPRRMTRKQFLDRFTAEEMAMIMAAASANPAITAWLTMFQSAELVDLSDASLQIGVAALGMAGLLAEGRAQEILAA